MAIIRGNCPHCPAEHVAFELKWIDRFPATLTKWNCVAVCGACNQPVCFIAIAKNGANHNPPTSVAGDVAVAYSIPIVWPIRPQATAPQHTPPAVKKRYLEGEDAFARNNWNSAVAMYRSALDIATKGMNGVPQGQTFFARLEWLHQQHRITPDIRSWGDHVRVEGNAALHDPEDFDENDAKSLRFFTEMFLRYVFELPGAVREFRGEANPA